jgi:hypothetical protein
MHARDSYQFSAPALKIDFQRIVDEATDKAEYSDDFDSIPSLIRVTVEGGHVVTLAHRQTLIGALLNQDEKTRNKLLDAQCFDLNDTFKFATVQGLDGLFGQDAAFTQESDWVAFQGDFVKELSNRRECVVEVF